MGKSEIIKPKKRTSKFNYRKGEKPLTDLKVDNMYLQPVEIAEGIYWVGFVDKGAGLHCNPYLIVEGDEAVLIDGGSRGDFSTVMLKILRAGVNPKNISRLIYHHADPDLCGNIPHLEAIIENPDLKIISHKENNTFINYYSSLTPKQCIEDLEYRFEFATGRTLRFILTPYAHTPGNFITYDEKTKTLFSSDIFGSYDRIWELYLNLEDNCHDCKPLAFKDDTKCPIYGIIDFHQKIMNSAASLRYALDRIEELDIELVAPQHGSLIYKANDRHAIIKALRSLEHVGFDYFIEKEKKKYE